MLQTLPKLFRACSGQIYFSVGWISVLNQAWFRERLLQRLLLQFEFLTVWVYPRCPIALYPVSQVIAPFFSALPSSFVYTCVPLCVVVMKGGGEKRVGLGMSSMALSRSEASPELK